MNSVDTVRSKSTFATHANCFDFQDPFTTSRSSTTSEQEIREDSASSTSTIATMLLPLVMLATECLCMGSAFVSTTPSPSVLTIRHPVSTWASAERARIAMIVHRAIVAHRIAAITAHALAAARLVGLVTYLFLSLTFLWIIFPLNDSSHHYIHHYVNYNLKNSLI